MGMTLVAAQKTHNPVFPQISQHQCAMLYGNTLPQVFSAISDAWPSDPGRVMLCFRLVSVTGFVKRTACLALSVLAAFAGTALRSCLRSAGIES